MSKFPIQYTPVDKLEVLLRGGKRRANVYGVVKFISFKGRSHGTSHISIISLHNDALYSLRDKFVITIFEDQNSDLPRPDVGDIMRFDNLQLDYYQSTCNGKCVRSYGSHWYIFDGKSKDYNIKSTSSPKPHIDKYTEVPIIDGLRQWISQASPSDDYPFADSDPASGSKYANTASNTTLTSSHGVFKLPNPIITGNTTLHSRISNVPTFSAHNLSNLKLKEVTQLNVMILSIYKWMVNEEINLLSLEITDGTKPNLALNKPVLDVAELHSTFVKSHKIPESHIAFIVVYGQDNINRALQLNPGACYTISHVRPMLYNSVGAPELYVHDRFKCSFTLSHPDDREAITQKLNQLVPDWDKSTNNNDNLMTSHNTVVRSIEDQREFSEQEITHTGKSNNGQPETTYTSTSTNRKDVSMRNMTALSEPPIKRTKILNGFTRLLVSNVPEITLRELQSLKTSKNRLSLHQINVYVTNIELSLNSSISAVLLCITCQDDSLKENSCTLHCTNDDLKELCGVHDERALLEPGMLAYLRVLDLQKTEQPVKLLVKTINNKHYITHTKIIAPI